MAASGPPGPPRQDLYRRALAQAVQYGVAAATSTMPNTGKERFAQLLFYTLVLLMGYWRTS